MENKYIETEERNKNVLQNKLLKFTVAKNDDIKTFLFLFLFYFLMTNIYLTAQK